VLAVIDDPAAAERAVSALAAAGIDPARIERFQGLDDTAAFDGTGAQHGVSARLRRAVEFVMMDQAPDLAWYEAALREGRSVVSVRVRGRAAVARVVQVLRANDGHFINHFGLLATEEIERWRGPDPRLPEYLLR
jgi:hypothetical protein